MTQVKAEWEKATQAIHDAQSILIVTHVGPDGDAIGSALGLGNALAQMGKTVTVADDDGTPDYLQFLPGSAQITQSLTTGQWDLMISTDASDEARTGNCGTYGRANSSVVINLDHHVTNTYFGDIYLVVPSAVSSTEIVHDWWVHVGITWTPEIARPLLTGLVTDTLGFRTSNVTAHTLHVAQSLMQHGASLAESTSRTLESKSWQEVQVWKNVIPTAELHGEVVSAIIRREDILAASLEDLNTSGLVSFLNQVNEARIAIVYKEEPDNTVKISMRSKPGYNVADVAFALGGGGHKQAAGATLSGSIEEAQSRVTPLLQEAVLKGSPQVV